MVGEVRYLFAPDAYAISLAECDEFVTCGYWGAEGTFLGVEQAKRRFWDRYWRLAV